MSAKLKTRMSLRELDHPENHKKRHDFLKAWRLVQQLPASHPNSFWQIGTYHGMPFKKREVEPLSADKDIWGGYCQHANVLFPTWHRFYCLKLEESMQSVFPDGDVALHYWDTTSDETLTEGLPSIVLDNEVEIDGEIVLNPLKSFTMPVPLTGDTNSNYVKEAGYITRRYPFSGIRNPEAHAKVADQHNIKVLEMDETPEDLLQENVHYWMNPQRSQGKNSVYHLYEECLNAPDYNAFSNTTSASGKHLNLEAPHDDVHMMIGGYPFPKLKYDGSVKLDRKGNISFSLLGANGDMGFGETAGFDPIFYLHHSNVDRMFWVWQKKWGFEKNFTITDENGGGTTSNAQGPTPHQKRDQTLNMDTILYPYKDKRGNDRTSRDCIDITKLGYTYSIGSLDKKVWPKPKYNKENVIHGKVNSWDDCHNQFKQACRARASGNPIKAYFDLTDTHAHTTHLPMFNSGCEMVVEFEGHRWKRNNFLIVRNLDRESIDGSFVIQLYVKKDGKLFYIGQRGILDRWERENCANCQKHRYTDVRFHVNDLLGHSGGLKSVVILVVSPDPKTGTKKIVNFNNFIHKTKGAVPEEQCAPLSPYAYIKDTTTQAQGDAKVPGVSFVTSFEQVVA